MKSKNTQVVAAGVSPLGSTKTPQSVAADVSPPSVNPGSSSQTPKSTLSPLPSENSDPEHCWLTKREIAAHLRISVRSVDKRMGEGLPYHLFGRSIRFLLDEVDHYARTVTLRIDTSRKKIDPRASAPQSLPPSGSSLHIKITKLPPSTTKGSL